jgi:predicted metal-dependent phosphoesterase TrpH
MTPSASPDPRRLLHPDDLADPASVRPEGGSVFDLHAHSSDYSRDSGVRIARIAEQAVSRGLDGIVLTEHNATWETDILRELSELHQVHLLPGMEIGTDVGHVLVYGLEQFTPELLEIESLRRIVRAEGAAMALAHPMRPFHGQHAAHDRYEEWFDAIETINGDHADSEDGPFELLAKRLGIGAIGGSDVHSVQAVGRAVTTFESAVESIEDLIDQLRAAVARPRDLRPRNTIE